MNAHTRFKDSIYHAILKDDLAGIQNGLRDLPRHFAAGLEAIHSIPAAKFTHSYAPGKWTVAQVIGHLSDTQTVFLNRILYIARGEKAELHPFDEGLWVGNAGHNNLGREAILSLYAAGAAHVQTVVDAMPPESVAREGIANHVVITVEEIILYLMAHERHHLKVIRERYLA